MIVHGIPPAALGKVRDEYHDAQAFYVVMIISGVCIGLTHTVHFHITSSASIIELNLWHGQWQTQQYPCYNTNGRGWGVNFVVGLAIAI